MKKTHRAANENLLGNLRGLLSPYCWRPLTGCPRPSPLLLPYPVIVTVMLLCVICGLVSLKKIVSFREYRSMYQTLLSSSMRQMDAAKQDGAAAEPKADLF